VAWFPQFPSSVAVPFCRSVVPLPFFRSVATVAIAGDNGNAGNVFAYAYGGMEFLPVVSGKNIL